MHCSLNGHFVCWAAALALGCAGTLGIERPLTRASTQLPSGMVRVSGGTFQMGTDPARIEDLLQRFKTKRRELFLAEVPAHRVSVASFWMDRTEVTNAEFGRFVAQHPEWGPARLPRAEDNGDYLKHWVDGSPRSADLDRPVTFVTWKAAVAYCEANGRRLPAEAEWEFAAGGGNATAEFPWGDAEPDATKANWSGTGLGAPGRVGSFAPNAFGLYDMAGNVWEFVQDVWTENYAAAGSATFHNSAVPATASQGRRVIRGGSFGGSAINLRVRYRDSHPETGAGPHVGFRCARSDPS